MYTEYVEINGISQFFLHVPNPGNDVAIMLHGGPGMPNSRLAYFHKQYFDTYSAVYYDQRWSGKTQLKNKTPFENMSMDTLVEDLRQTIKYVKEKYATERVFLAGHSFGSLLGTMFIAKHPGEVWGYIGYGQVVDSSQDKNWYENLKETIARSGKKSDKRKLATVNEAYPNLPKQEYVKSHITLCDLEYKYGFKKTDYVNLYRKSPLLTLRCLIQMIQTARGGKAYQSLIGELYYGFDITGIKEYETPVCCILGRNDEWTSSRTAAEYFDAIQAPKKQLHWIDDAGHMVDTDNPEKFFCALAKIIRTT
ncbi:MAG: alpha/beta hydrolase [Defluviitaleaceae bacterium]|nr:alpha/beta hydrolase [Defluviitaleaceae bacterium]